jgi:hypothetical protein
MMAKSIHNNSHNLKMHRYSPMLPQKRVRFAPTIPSQTNNADENAGPMGNTCEDKYTSGCANLRARKRQRIQSNAESTPMINHSPLVTVMEFLPCCKDISSAERANRWYSKEEQKQMRQNLHAQVTNEQISSFCSSFAELYEACLDDSDEGNEWLKQVSSSERKPLPWLAHHYDEWRGVEGRVALATSAKRCLARKFVAAIILSVVNKKGEGMSSTSSSTVAQAVRVAEILSHRAKRLARHLAIADAFAASKEYLTRHHTDMTNQFNQPRTL